MTDKDARAARLEAAAGWYAELQDNDIAADVWERFATWERDPENAAAFRQIERSLAAVDRAHLAAGARRRLSGRVGVWAGAAAAVAAIAVAAAVLFSGSVFGSGQGKPQTETFATATGEQREVRLADGSVIVLNTSTRLDVTLTSQERLVRLGAGQAYFEVAHRAAPFVVEAGGHRTTALGTAFEVYVQPEGLVVTLVEGSVSVSAPGQQAPRRLEPGQRLQISGDVSSIREVDTDFATVWKTGMVEFRDATLSEAAAELNRYSQTRILLMDPQLADERLSGAFPVGEQDLFAESLALYLPVNAVRVGDEIRITARAGEAASAPGP